MEREIEGGGREVVEVSLPCVIGATRGLNEPHYPKLPEIMQAKKKEIKVIDIAALGLNPADGGTTVIHLEPVPERGQARMLEGSTREKVEQLVSLLSENEKFSVIGCRKTAPRAVIRRCAAFVNAHISMNMLRFPKRRTPWLTADACFSTPC